MELKEIHEVWDRFDKSDLSEMTFEKGDVHLVLKKENAYSSSMAEGQLKNERVVPDSGVVKLSPKVDNTISIKSPLVGSFYRASAPGEPPFVTIGKKVKKGDVIGIVEAMKMMNEIVSEEEGIVQAIEAQDGELVGFDQVLVRLGG